MQTNEKGDVILKIDMNTKSARAALNDLGRAVNGVFKAFKGERVSSPQLNKLNAQADQSKKKIEELQKSIQKMATTKVQTKEGDKLAEEWSKANAKVVELREKYKDFVDAYEKGTVSTLPSELTESAKKLEEIENKISSLVGSGKDVTTVAAQQPKEYAKANEQLRQEQSNLAGIQTKIDSISTSGNKATSGVSNGFKNMGVHVKSAFDKIRSHAKSSSKSAAESFGNLNGAIKNGIKTVVKYGLGMRSLFVLFRKLRSAVVESYKDLAEYSTDINNSVSGAKSALSTLKRSVASAVQPLVTTFAPIVTSLANKLTGFSNTVGRFFATLTGQDYVYEATNLQESYADSLKDTAKNAKNATKALDAYLSPLDDINRFTPNETIGNGEDTAALTSKFTRKSVDNSFKGLADKIKSYFSDIFRPIKSAWEKYGNPVVTEWNTLLGNIKSTISNIATAFRNVWANGSGERTVGNILKLWRTILGIANAFVSTFNKAWNKDSLGETVIQSFIDRFNNLLGFIRAVAETFRQVWNDGTGEQIWTNILTIVRGINGIIGGFWSSLTKAWKANENGQRIWGAILGVVKDVTGFLSNIATITTNWINELDLAPITSAIATLLEGFRSLNAVLMEHLKDAYEKVLLPIAKWTIEKALPALIKLFGNALKFVARVLKSIPVEVITNIGEAILILFAAIKGYQIIRSVITWISGLGTAFKNLFSAIGGAVASNPYLAVFAAFVAAITAVTVAVRSYNQIKWNNSELKKATEKISEYAGKVKEAADNINEAVKTANSQMIEVKADITQVDSLKKRLLEVIKDGIISEDEMPEYKTVIDLLNKVDGFQEMWDGIELQDINGQIHVNTEEATKKINDFVKDYKRASLLTAAQSAYGNLVSAQIQNKIDTNIAFANKEAAAKALVNYVKENMPLTWEKVTDEWGEDTPADTLAYIISEEKFHPIERGIDWVRGGQGSELLNAYNEATKAADEYTRANSSANKSVDGLNDLMLFLNGQTDNYRGLVWAVRNGILSESDALEYVKDQGIDSYSTLKDLASKQASTSQENSMTEIEMNGHMNAQKKSNDMEYHRAYYKGNADMSKSNDDFARNAVGNSSKVKTAFSWLVSDMKQSFKSVDTAKIGWDWMTGLSTSIAENKKQVISQVDGLAEHIRGIFSQWGIAFAPGVTPSFWNWLSKPSATVPALAQGAVLPAGRPFLAMLGDQSSGTNLEAPESLIRQIVREETQGLVGGPDTPVNVNIDGQTLFSFVLRRGQAYSTQTGHNPFSLEG